MLIGQILVQRGIVTGEELARALSLQRHRGGRLGPLMVSMGITNQPTIDQTWMDALVRPPLVAALDRGSGNRFTQSPDNAVEFLAAMRRETMIENMLEGSHLLGMDVTLDGRALMRIGEARSPEIEFSLDMASGFVVLSDPSEVVARRWVDLVHRGIAAGSRKAPGVNAPAPTSEAA